MTRPHPDHGQRAAVARVAAAERISVRRTTIVALGGLASLFVLVAAAKAETYSRNPQADVVRNHATHEDAEAIIMSGEMLSASVERGIHSFAVISDGRLFNCVLPWDSFAHCRSQTVEPIFPLKQ